MTAVAPIDKLLLTDIRRALRDWCHLWGVEEIAPEISVEISSRMTRSLGRCYPDRKLIRIAQFVREESDALVQEVLCHEAAHIAAHHLYGSSIRPHGPEWKALMQKAGFPPSVKYRRVSLVVPAAGVPKRGGIGSTLRNLRQQILRRLARI
jgi:predicted metal-dependent hydrolase